MALLTYIILLAFLNATFGDDCVINNVPEYTAWEKQLRNDLKCKNPIYDPPNGNSTERLSVNIRFIMKYFTFNSKEEVFSVQSWMYVSWIDYRLKWDPEKYFGIKDTEVSTVNIWSPNFILYNSADSNDFDRFLYVRCHLKYTGEVLCVPRITHEALCNVKLTHWPYDVQECSLEFGAWTTNRINFKMNFASKAITMLGADYGAEWFISDYKQESNNSAEKQLKMIFVLQREADSLAALVVYPSMILTVLSITSLILDVRSNVRLSLACFSLLSHYYFLLELAQNIPLHNAEPPSLLLYYRGSVILTVLIIMFTFILAGMCKSKSIPQNFIISMNDFVYESFGNYLVFPRWDFLDDDSKGFSQDWTKFANILNSVFIFIIILAYIILYISLMPHPVPLDY